MKGFLFLSERLYLYTIDMKDKIQFKNGLSLGQYKRKQKHKKCRIYAVLHVQNFTSSCFSSFMDSGIQLILSLYSIRTNSKPEEVVAIVIKWTLSHSNRSSFQMFSQQQWPYRFSDQQCWLLFKVQKMYLHCLTV